MTSRKVSLPRGRLLGEFVLIVLGVLAALMVDTWIEQRKDDDLREQYLARLVADLASDIQALDYRVAYFNSVRSFGLHTLDRLQSDAPVDTAAVIEAFWAAEIFAFRANDSTYQDLLSTGNIRLLRSIEQRLALATYHTKTASLSEEPSRVYREVARGIIPIHIQTAIRNNCPTTDPSDSVPTGFPPCVLAGFTQEDARSIFAELREYPRISNILTYRISDVDVAIFLYGVQRAAAAAVLEQL